MTTIKAGLNKYKAKGVWVDIKSLTQFVNPPSELKKTLTFFDSQLEFNCYLILRNFFKERAIISIHKRIQIADFPFFIEGYKSINYWKPDFLVSLLDHNGKIYKQFVIEIKGQVLQPFPYQYALFRLKYPNISVLVVGKKQELVDLLKKAGF